MSGAELPPPRVARRRLAGWGFEDVVVAAPRRMLAWLAARLGPGQASPVLPPRLAELSPPRPLPPLPGASSRAPDDRFAAARGQGLPDLLWLRAGRVPALPDAVLRPAEEEIGALLAACARHQVKVVPRGGGTSVTGGVNIRRDEAPIVILDLVRLVGLQSLDAAAGLASFGAGTPGPALEHALGEHHLTLGHLPQSWELSTLGGWVVTRSAGQESLGYGRIEDLVAGLELVAPAGALSLPARPASAAGPDLRQLVLGSEGRLGVVTRVTVRVRPRPAGREVRAWLLPSWEGGVEAVRSLVRERAPLAMLRLSDPVESEAALAVGLGQGAVAALGRRYLALRGVAAGCLLLAGAHGEPAARRRAFAAAGTVLGTRRAVPLGRRPGERWLADRFRHPYLRDALLDAGYATETLETAAPWSRLGEVHRAMAASLGAALGAAGEPVTVLCHLSHAYLDGASLYFTCFFRLPAGLEEGVARWATLKRAANEALIGLGSTLSHHHGVGSWHAPWLQREVGERGVAALAASAATLDPAAIMNPGVLLAPEDRLES